MEGKLKRIDVELQVLSPLHIGSHEQALTHFGYAVSGNTLFVISQDRLAEYLGERGLVDRFVARVEREGNKFRIGDFLKEVGADDATVKRLSRYSIPADNPKDIRQLKVAIRDPEGITYIPGTAIKGAIRTACLYAFLKDVKASNPDYFKIKVIDRLMKKMADIGKSDKNRENRKEFFKGVEDLIARGFVFVAPSEQKGVYGKSGLPNTDIFRCLQVSDAFPVRENIQEKATNVVVCDTEPGTANALTIKEEAPLYVEAVEGGAYRFSLTWDEWLAEEFYRQNRSKVERKEILYFPRGIDDVLHYCKVFVKDQVEHEEKFFQKCVNGGPYLDFLETVKREKANFRLGWGSGLIGASLSLLLPPELMREVRDKFFRKRDRRVDDFPKSRRVAVLEKGKRELLGFCRLVKLDEGANT
ncbi:MAG: type III-A CRISPR-associated RAMP protein Csm5 [Candidatus Geothermincolales bacterium]